MELTNVGRAVSLYKFYESVSSSANKKIILGYLTGDWTTSGVESFNPVGMSKDSKSIERLGMTVNCEYRVVYTKDPSATVSATEETILYNGQAYYYDTSVSLDQAGIIAECIKRNSYKLYIKFTITNDTNDPIMFRQVGFSADGFTGDPGQYTPDGGHYIGAVCYENIIKQTITAKSLITMSLILAF